MLSNDTQKINTILTFPATRTSNLTVKNNFNISACTLNTNYEKKSKELTSPHSCQSVTFSPSQQLPYMQEPICIISEGKRVGGGNNCGKMAVVETR